MKATSREFYGWSKLLFLLCLASSNPQRMVLATSSATTTTNTALFVGAASFLPPKVASRRRNNTKAMTTSSSSSPSAFQMGRDTLRVDFELHRENRLRLAQAMEEKRSTRRKRPRRNVTSSWWNPESKRRDTARTTNLCSDKSRIFTGCLAVERAIVSERSTLRKRNIVRPSVTGRVRRLDGETALERGVSVKI